MAEPKMEKKKQSFKKLILIVLIFIVVFGGSFTVYNLFFSKKSTSTTTSKTSTTMKNITSAKTYSIDECLVNLTDSGGKNYLKVTVFLGYEDGKLDAELAEKKPIIRDAVIDILRSKSTADFSSNKADKIKIEVLQKINPLLTKGQLDNVYFDDILVQ